VTEHDGDDASSVPCPDCGTSGRPGARFCHACGSPLDPTDPGAQPTGQFALRTARPPSEDRDTGEIERVTVPLVEGGGRECPSCGAPNSTRRELCGRCGADLDTGELTVRPEPLRFGRGEQDDGPRRRGWLAPLLAVAAVAALVVAGLALAGVGPFEDRSAVVAASFDPDRYPDDPDRLALSEVAASSTLPDQGDRSYAPTMMVDEDPATAWNSDGGGEGEEGGLGERIDLGLAEPSWVQRLVIANGDQRDPDAYAANARLKRAQLTVDGGLTFVINLLDEGLGEQAVEFREPVLTTALRIEVLEVFPGDTHPDLAISDLAVEGWPADGEDVELAEQRSATRPATGTT
jgi:hypothetical protein